MAEYHNPQQDPGAEKRLLLAFLLVFIAIAAMQYFLPKPKTPPPTQQPAPTEASQTTAPATTVQQEKKAAVKTRQPARTAAPSAPVKQAASESEVILENELARITFTNRGGQVTSWILKKYKDEKGKPLDLVNPYSAPTVGLPLSLFSYDKDLQQKINSALYVSGRGEHDKDNSVSFEYADADVQARKTFTLPADSYVLSVDTQVMRNGQAVQAFPQWPGGMGDQSTPASYATGRIDWNQDSKIEHKKAFSGFFLTGRKWVAGGETFKGPFQWAATADQYFAAAFMPDNPEDAALVTLHQQIDIPKDLVNPKSGETTKVSVLGIGVGSVTGHTQERLFAGPKAVDVLESTKAQPGGPDLRGVIDFGMFSFIVRPLFIWLKWTHEHMISNWGWAIAFLTLAITLALVPLRMKSMKSALKMQKIQPQVKAINEKYKRYSLTDPRRAEMQKEMSELYKKEGVNPLGGCLPMLLQLPFLYAFYAMVENVIEMRHAHWLWIKDLSAPDPWHVLPILIMITMFVTQKSTPQAGMDPVQQKMLQFMSPIMMGWISWFLSSGLGVYWVISNLVSYGQQIYINQTEFGKQVQKTIQRRAQRKR